MKKQENPFTSLLPSIDLHGCDKITAKVKTEEFINDNLKLKNYEIAVIHGKGSGILKKEIHEYLKRKKEVLSFKTDYFNDGMTIIKLKNNKNGFTLVELLAVIALIGTIMLIIMPNIINSYNASKKKIFQTNVIGIYNSAYTTFLLRDDGRTRYCGGNDKTLNALDITNGENVYYDITLNDDGEVLSLKVSDKEYGISLSGNPITASLIKVDDITDKFTINCE